MKKRLLIAFLAIAAGLSCAFSLTACVNQEETSLSETLFFGLMSPTDGSDKYYEVSANYNASESVLESTSEIIIPATYKNLPVKRISYYAEFSRFKNLKKITLPDSITYITEQAFMGCDKLEEINIPESIESIGSEVFSGCTALNNVNIPRNVKEIEERAFEGCTALKNLNLSDGVKVIGDYAFQGCSALEKVELPDGITDIPSGLFVNCSSLKELIIPESISAIGYDAFSGCTALESFTVPDHITVIGTNVFNGCTSLKTLTIPCIFERLDYLFGKVGADYYGIQAPYNLETVILTNPQKNKKIPSFWQCETIKSVTIPAEITEIPESTFLCCSALENITIPKSVAQIGHSAFSNCTSITSIVIPDSVTKVQAFTFSDCSALENIYFGDETASKSNLVSIGESAFRNCSSLINITIPEKVTNIKSSAFDGCDSLMGIFLNASNLQSNYPYPIFGNVGNNSLGITLKVSKTVKSIPKSFISCTNLFDIEFDANCNCTTIGASAFSGCKKLCSVSLNDGIENIENGAFSNTGLIQVYLPSTVRSIGENAFASEKLVEIYNLSDVKITAGDRIAPYAKRVYDSGIASAVFNQGSFTFFADNSSGATNYYLMGVHNKFATDVTLPSSVIMNGAKVADTYKIYDGAFCYSNITSFNVNNTAVEIDEATAQIKDFDFMGCNRLESINITADIKKYSSYGGMLFNKDLSYCLYIPSGIKNIEMPTGVVNLYDKNNITGYYTMLKNLTHIETLTLPDDLTYIPSEICPCITLKEITIPKSVEQFGAVRLINDKYYLIGNIFIYSESFDDFAFTINYKGTIEQWKAIPKNSNNKLADITVHCTDGDTIYGESVEYIKN